MERQTLFPPLILPAITSATTTTTTTTVAPATPAQPTARFANSFSSSSSSSSSGTISTEGWAITLLVLTSVRLVLIVSLWIYLTYRTIQSKVRFTRVWLSQLLLATLALSHVVLYAFVVRPSPVSCGIVRMGVGLVYAFCFAILMVKLVLIMAANKGYDIPRVFQMLLLALMVGIQFALSVQWVTLLPSAVTEEVPASCDISLSEWLHHLIYVMLLIVIGTIVSITIHDIKANHREAMFLGIAIGFNIPVWIIWSMTAALLKAHHGIEEKCLAYGMFAGTTLIIFVMFLPRSRQLSAIGEVGLYTEDTPVVKPISELTVHKLYYPVYEDRRRSLDVLPRGDMVENGKDDSGSDILPQEVEVPSISRGNHHWYPPFREGAMCERNHSVTHPNVSFVPTRRYHYPNPNSHFENPLQHSGARRVHLGPSTSGGCGSHGTLSSTRLRCLTPPSEEGSTTPSGQESDGQAHEDSDVDIADYHERNVDGVSYTQVTSRQPMY